MTDFQTLLRAIEVRGRDAAARAGDALAAAAIAELPGVAVTRDGADVLLTAPGLRARAFGSRRSLPDPRLTGLVR
ncbi:hypothetical protein [Glacieibacterium frigidum]|uniref:Uncharacterized protein n=1 Tax=Glacieibacterium frigidum TaxID=2593303 RepID=A0A552U816_9SPHN|nr:hypothetical protein [Glacieibacterium frigidum]TRW14363.1 hypothetical protein FMM06_11670 [Glacieibacterium frigidum]